MAPCDVTLDRAAIAARIADFRASIADWGHLSETESAAAVSGIETLLGDSARYRNALKVAQETIALVTRERDEARHRVTKLANRNLDLCSQLRKSKPIPVTERLPTHIYSVFIFVLDDLHDDHWDIGIYNAQRGKWQCNDGDRDRDVAVSHWIDQPDDPRISLAAADGQPDLLTADQALSTLTPEQRAATEALRQQMFGDGVADGQQPYIVQGFLSPCRKYIASVHLSNGQITVQDDNGDVWEPTGKAEDMAKVTL